MSKYRELKKLKKYNSACVISHMNADTDAIASLLLTRNMLKHLGIKRVDILTDTESTLDNYDVLGDISNINSRTVVNYDVAVIVDCASVNRTGKYASLFNNAKVKVNIDHHDTNTNEGDINIVEIVSSSVEVLYGIMSRLNYKFTTQDYNCIYSGIITDTDNLTVGKITASTFNVLGKCVAANIDNKSLYKRFFASNNLKTIYILGLAIQNITPYENGKVLITHISREEEIEFNSHDEDYEGIINQLARTKDCELIAFIKPRNDEYYVSMRSRGNCNVADVAIKNGGGGHRGAAAFSSSASLEEIEQKVLEDFREALASRQPID